MALSCSQVPLLSTDTVPATAMHMGPWQGLYYYPMVGDSICPETPKAYVVAI